MNQSTERLIPPSLLHRFLIPCLHTNKKWNADKGIELGDEYQIPNFGEIDGLRSFADVHVGWSSDGLFVNVQVAGKRQSLWCRETQLTESDGLQVWIDTRNTHNVHRANQFCHWFLFLPSGGGNRREDAIGTMLKINRAKEDPKTLNQIKPAVQVSRKVNGYRLSTWIPARSITGWDPQDHRKLGFNFAIFDREFGWQTLSIGPEFPIGEDPSLWQTIELVE